MSLYVGTRDVVRASGTDATTYLQGQISQDVEAMAVGDSAWSLVLQPQGKVDALFRISHVEHDVFLLDVEPGWGDALLARLQRFLLRVKVDLSLATWDFHAYRDEVADPARYVEHESDSIIADVDWNGPGTDVIAPTLRQPDRDTIDAAEFDLLRIKAGIPAMGSELDENTIPAEAGIVDRAVSFTKGCYTGQELVARIDSRGNNTPRSLHLVRGAGDVPRPGTDITIGGDVAGVITSTAPDGSDWVGLAYLKRKFQAPVVAQTTSGEASIVEIHHG